MQLRSGPTLLDPSHLAAATMAADQLSGPNPSTTPASTIERHGNRRELFVTSKSQKIQHRNRATLRSRRGPDQLTDRNGLLGGPIQQVVVGESPSIPRCWMTIREPVALTEELLPKCARLVGRDQAALP